jgi:adenylate cyclase
LAIEIERKFLPLDESWRAGVERSVRMAQGYLNDLGAVESGRQRCSVRVRIAGDQAFLNLKSREAGRSRQEFDYAIPRADAEALLALCSGGLIDKQRHYLHYGGFLWEIDEFLGDNRGLVVAEIELPAVDTEFERPAWLGSEVTELQRYYNLALAERPFARWSPEEKLACS